MFTGERISYEERLGFIVGYVAGLLNPDLSDAFYDNLTYLDALSYKCEELYSGGPTPGRYPIEGWSVRRQPQDEE